MNRRDVEASIRAASSEARNWSHAWGLDDPARARCAEVASRLRALADEFAAGSRAGRVASPSRAMQDAARVASLIQVTVPQVYDEVIRKLEHGR